EMILRIHSGGKCASSLCFSWCIVNSAETFFIQRSFGLILIMNSKKDNAHARYPNVRLKTRKFMDIFTKYNKKSIQDRQIDTLIGLSKGLTADGKINQAE